LFASFTDIVGVDRANMKSGSKSYMMLYYQAFKDKHIRRERMPIVGLKIEFYAVHVDIK
jgi:hypothetical protein